MHRTFKYKGMLASVVSSDSADSIREWLANKLPGTKIVGEVSQSEVA